MTAPDFDWKAPDYTPILASRAERLARIRARPELIAALKTHYARDIAAFIDDWGLTSDPRNRNKGLPVETPFVLFPKQHEMLNFVLERMHNREPGLIEKSRDCGASWLVACLAGTLCLLNRNVVVGIGSRTEAKIDRSGDPDSIFWKIKFFLSHLPPEFRGSWDESRHSAHMRVQFPESGSAIVGEAGDGIGRGGRSTVYFVDEAAFIERPQLIEASLASNTECRIDISTPNGRANSFAVKRHSGRVKAFTFGWRDDPRKDDAWYARQCEVLDPVTRAQEIDLSYDASIEGLLIPVEWIHAAVGAHQKLGIEPTGAHRGALDVADEGKDRCAFTGRRGILLKDAQSWSGRGSDIYTSVVRTFGLCEHLGYTVFDYDADGLGAGVRGDAVNINQQRREAGKSEIDVEPFRGSGGVFDPDGSLVEGRANKDYFANLKAQAWWSLRLRFQATYRAVVEKMPYDADSIISIDPALPELTALVTELVQPTYSVNQVGKIIVNKAPDGAASPNLADAVMIAFSPFRTGAYFATPAVATVSTSTVMAHPLPRYPHFVFAFMAFAVDSCAVVYCAANRASQYERDDLGCCILDWNLCLLDSDAPAWMWNAAKRLNELHGLVGCAMPPKVFCDTFDDGFAKIMQQSGFPATPVGEELPPPSERLAMARPYVNTGLVSFAQPAHDRMITFKGATRNFLRELSTQVEIADTNPLGQALASIVLMKYTGDDSIPTPLELVPEPAPTAPQPWRGFRIT